jgi:hypothetical protein
MAETAHRVTIGFRGGQVLAARIASPALDALRGALSGGGWHELETVEGKVQLNLDQVGYVDEESTEHRVGFGT